MGSNLTSVEVSLVIVHAVRKNTAELIHSGMSADQAYAIAKDVQRDARKLKKLSSVKS